MTPKELMHAAMRKLDLTVTWVYIPHRGDRSNRSLQWDVTVNRGDTEVLCTRYSAGIGHCPSYRAGDRSVRHENMIDFEVRIGRKAIPLRGGDDCKSFTPGDPIVPDPADVMFSLTRDADALDHPSFESWANELGLDTDSRNAERSYRACLDIGLRLRAAVGETGLSQLRSAAQDY